MRGPVDRETLNQSRYLVPHAAPLTRVRHSQISIATRMTAILQAFKAAATLTPPRLAISADRTPSTTSCVASPVATDCVFMFFTRKADTAASMAVAFHFAAPSGMAPPAHVHSRRAPVVGA
uniref:hypothetical protein n=1 Tax=Burkholderia arboris TaxID=488730 RepID=UPI003BEF0C2B